MRDQSILEEEEEKERKRKGIKVYLLFGEAVETVNFAFVSN